MDNQFYINKIFNRLNISFRTLAQGKNIIYHPGGIEWFMFSTPGGIERIFNIQLSEDNAHGEIQQLIDLIKVHKAPNSMITTPLSIPKNIEEILMANGFSLIVKTDQITDSAVRTAHTIQRVKGLT